MVDIEREKKSLEEVGLVCVGTFILYVIFTIIGVIWKYAFRGSYFDTKLLTLFGVILGVGFFILIGIVALSEFIAERISKKDGIAGVSNQWKKCPYCHKKIPVAESICYYCQKNISKTEIKSDAKQKTSKYHIINKKCPHCHKEIPKTATRCYYCHMDVNTPK